VNDVHDLRLHRTDWQGRPRLVALLQVLLHLVALRPIVIDVLECYQRQNYSPFEVQNLSMPPTHSLV